VSQLPAEPVHHPVLRGQVDVRPEQRRHRPLRARHHQRKRAAERHLPVSGHVPVHLPAHAVRRRAALPAAGSAPPV